MAASRLALAALRLPWKDLLKAAPLILTASGELVARLADRRRGPIEPAPADPDDAAMLVMRLEALEAAGESQAELTKALARQIEELSQVLRSMALRILFALGFSLLGLTLGLIALVRTFR